MHWLACGEGALPPDDDWLAPAERDRLAGQRFTKRRTEYRLRRWAAKQAVAAVLGLEADPARLAAVEVLNRPGGAPHVRLDGDDLALDVSLTDRAGWAVCLVGDRTAAGPGDALGVDLELVEPRSDAFVADYFTATERDYMRGRPTREERDVAANLLWSAKESALKVLQTGLRTDTRSVEVHLARGPARPDGWAALEVRPAGREPLPGWWRRDGAFVLTTAGAPPDPAAGPTAGPPTELGTAAALLATAVPVHSWQERPLTGPAGR